ncbi:hypothetical protein [Sphingobium yanoikuyae]|uniref:Uncharacterized protein n=1 Tax=Sphingobium yanoikuyae TaxID=13690 RepID=A0A3G2UMP1_SPHYA|nr:hypothetical protein [Sphingobium yanoikuyae]AYO76430.1 hypothetical protein EBF16_05415 [Sphingobium yanoikuyae]
MAAIGVPNLKATGVAEDVTRPKRWRDATLKDVPNDGVRFMFDLAFPWSYPGGDPATRPAAGNPSNGAIIYDMTEHANGRLDQIAASGGALVTYAGGGFDYTGTENPLTGGAGTTASAKGVIIPASVLADIFAAYGGASQHYLLCMYVKLASKANMDNTQAGLITIASDDAYNAAPSMINLGFQLGAVNVGRLQVRRQTGAGTVETSMTVKADDGDFGTICQIAAWRNAAGQGLRLRSLTSGLPAKTATAALGPNNSQDFSAKSFAMGRTGAFSSNAGDMFNGFRLYRGFIENLARSGRDPLAVLDADYATVQARGDFA